MQEFIKEKIKIKKYHENENVTCGICLDEF